MGGFGDPDALEASARLLDRDADELRRRSREVQRTDGGLGWKGPAAQAFSRTLGEDLGSLLRAAGELEEAATALRRHADEVRERERELRELAESVTGWLP